MNKKIYAGQSFLDKVIETTGSIDNAFEMALLNKIAITDDLTVGSELKVSKITNQFLVNYFNENNRPATNVIAQIIAPTIEIDYRFPQGEFPISF